MVRRVLLVADEQVEPTARRYIRYFIDGDHEGGQLSPQDDLTFESTEQYQCFRLEPPDHTSLRALDLQRYTSVYFWGLYDHILLQDAFRKRGRDGEAIDSLPLSVAYHLLYSRGQFAATRRGRVQPIFLDPRLLLHTTLSGKAPDDIESQGETLQRERVYLRQALDTANFWGDLFPLGTDLPNRAHVYMGLPLGTFDEVSMIVREIVAQGNLRLLMIDDDLEWLRIPYEVLGGTNFPTQSASGSSGGRSNCLWVLTALEGKKPRVESLDFDKLTRAVSEFSANRGSCLSVVVTDVLFGRGSEKSGLDIVRHVRSVDDTASPRNVVIAFTGYSSPLLTAACHGEGADFVVQKTNTNRHGEARTDQGSEPSTKPLIEMFWNVLWLRAATWFTCERLAQLEHELRESHSSSMKTGEARRFVGQVSHDIDAVFPPQKWLTCFSHWRQQVVEILTESADYVHFWSNAHGHENRELKQWRTDILEQIKHLRNQFLSPKQQAAAK